MKKLYGYARVSTKKQGDVSLPEQKRMIQEFAEREGYKIVKFFEEKVTAAKEGRREFDRMIKLLEQKKADGVVMHKIDRSSRNFADWHKIGNLVDSGVGVFYADGKRDLSKRGDRMVSDYEMVGAVGFVRNLREEVIKGFYGRLNQGILPLPAPVGYLNEGRGKPKSIDPIKGPLIRNAFELYATGGYGLKKLSKKMYQLGLLNRAGKRVSFTHMSKILNNPFYYGIIKISKTNEIFKGIHKPVVSKNLFDQVKLVLEGKTPRRVIVHDFAFRRSIKCIHCKYSLIGELKKGRVYYRCHMKSCPTKTIREDRVVKQVLTLFNALSLTQAEQKALVIRADELSLIDSKETKSKKKNLQMMIVDAQNKIDVLTDRLITGVVDDETYRRKKNHLTDQLVGLEQTLATVLNSTMTSSDYVSQFLEPLKSLNTKGKTLSNHIIRKLVFKLTSNLYLDDRNVVLQAFPPFEELLKIRKAHFCEPSAGKPRTDKQSLEEGGDSFIYLPSLKLKKIELSKKEIQLFTSQIINYQTSA